MSDFFAWYYHDIPRLLLRAGRGYVRHAWYGLSVPTLGRTLLAPWKRDYEESITPSFIGQLQAGIENLISRLVGLIVRLATIGVAAVIVLFEVGFYLIAVLLWISLPFLIVLLLGLAVAQIRTP